MRAAEASTDRGVSSGEALTPSKGKGRAMHGQRMVEWLEVRKRCVTIGYVRCGMI